MYEFVKIEVAEGIIDGSGKYSVNDDGILIESDNSKEKVFSKRS